MCFFLKCNLASSWGPLGVSPGKWQFKNKINGNKIVRQFCHIKSLSDYSDDILLDIISGCSVQNLNISKAF